MKNVSLQTRIKHITPSPVMRVFQYVKHFDDNTIISEVKNHLKYLHTYTEEQIQQIQHTYLVNIVRYAQTHCSYYKKLFQEYSFDSRTLKEWDLLPTLNKDSVRKNERYIMSDEIMHLSAALYNTGGSSGDLFNFMRSYTVGGVDTEHQKFQLMSMGYKKGEPIFSIGGAQVPHELSRKNIIWQAYEYGPGFPYTNAIAGYMLKETVPYYIDYFLTLQPSIVRGYPSSIYAMALYIKEHSIEIPFVIKGVQFTSERVLPGQAELIAEVFKTTISYQYGHVEACAFAYTKPGETSYVCSPVYGYVEVLDEEGKQVKEGEYGEIVVTGFFNRAMPFIRYRTGDRAQYGGIKKGMSVLNIQDGRMQEVLYGKSGTKHYFSEVVSKKAYGVFKNIVVWQIEQRIPGYVHMKIVKSPDYSDFDESRIIDTLKQYAEVDTEIQYVERIDRTKGGKLLYMKQYFKNDSAQYV